MMDGESTKPGTLNVCAIDIGTTYQSLIWAGKDETTGVATLGAVDEGLVSRGKGKI